MMKKAPTLDQFCSCSGIGIDVSKASLEVVGLEKETAWTAEVSNAECAIEKLAQALKAGGYQHKIVCESTGHYHLLLGLVFARYDLDLRIINPLLSSKHRQSRIRKTKTDRAPRKYADMTPRKLADTIRGMTFLPPQTWPTQHRFRGIPTP